MTTQIQKARKLQRILLRWYRANKRRLPWRTTRDPYRILVSEIMLQQTQVRRVEGKYPLFLNRFPSIEALARARAGSVIRAWQGMGYNNRAVRLRTLARLVVRNHNGRIPSETAAPKKLPGVGKYTAYAIACFAFGKNLPVVDVNIRRVLSRIFWRMRTLLDIQRDAVIWPLAKKTLPKTDCPDWNQALMELGATICTARRTPRKPQEKLYAGLPQRIYRGRIVAVLSKLNGRGSIAALELGKAIKPHFSKREMPYV